MKTRDGIYYDLRYSDYKLTVNCLTYVFSSQLHLEKFRARLKENRDIINYSLSKRFNFDVNVEQLADIVLYKKIEKRGFRIITIDGKELCQKSLRYAGGKAIYKSSSV